MADRTQQVEAWVFRILHGKVNYLLLKRIPAKGSFWQPPCGGIESSDTDHVSAGFREILEETGITKDKIVSTITNFHEFKITKHYLTGKPITPITEFCNAYEVGMVDVMLDKNVYPEHDEFKWMSFEEALKSLKWEDNKTALKKLNELLSEP